MSLLHAPAPSREATVLATSCDATASTSAAAIEATGLTHRFGPTVALRGVTLRIGPGERVAVLGANGAGKSTLLRIFATLLAPSSGTLRLFGLDPAVVPEAVRRRIGVVAHRTYLDDELTGWENLRFYARLHDVPHADERIAEVLAVIGMQGRAQERVGALSRGQQQRLALARALLHDPDLLLLDEPDTGLDPTGIDALAAAIERPGAQRTLVVATHHPAHAARLTTRAIRLDSGRLVLEPGPSDGLALHAPPPGRPHPGPLPEGEGTPARPPAQVGRTGTAIQEALGHGSAEESRGTRPPPEAPWDLTRTSTVPAGRRSAAPPLEGAWGQTPGSTVPAGRRGGAPPGGAWGFTPKKTTPPLPSQGERGQGGEGSLLSSFLHTLAIAARDLRHELRRRDHILGTILLALLLLLTFAFAFDVDRERVQAAGPGVLWVALLLPGMTAAARSFAGERERGTLDGLLLAPIDRGAIYGGKLLAVLAHMLAIEAVLLPAYAALLDQPVLTVEVILPLAVGTLGIAAVATLFAAIAAGTRAREALLPVLLLPAATPLLIAGVRATDRALSGPGLVDDLPWLALSLAAAAVYLAAGLLLIDHVLEGP